MTRQATFFTNSYNQLPLLKNMLRSFELCNQSKAVEWVITDYGSTDGSREWLKHYEAKSSVPLALIFKDENDFFAELKVPQVDRRARIETILRKYRNEARAAAKGAYLFDIGTDHQFVRPADFVAEVEEVFRHRGEQVDHDDLSGVFVFGYFRWRLKKPNNALHNEVNNERVPYFVAKQKAYVDYSVMKKGTIKLVGPFLEVGDLAPGSPQMEWWQAGNHLEMDYMARCDALGLKRAIMKYPVSISFANDVAAELIKNHQLNTDGLIAPLWTLDAMQTRFQHLDRPVSSEELWPNVRGRARLLTHVLSAFNK